MYLGISITFSEVQVQSQLSDNYVNEFKTIELSKYYEFRPFTMTTKFHISHLRDK